MAATSYAAAEYASIRTHSSHSAAFKGILPDILRWFHDVHNTEAPLLPRFCELEETDDWLLGVTKLLELASTAIRCHKGCVSG